MNWLTQVRWSPYIIGIGIGILSRFTFLISKKALGCSTSFVRTNTIIKKLFKGSSSSNLYYQKYEPVIDWQWMLVLGILLGSLLSSLLSGDFTWQWIPSLWSSTFGFSAVIRIIAAFIGGIFLGFGARWAGGCTSGHGISGTLQLAVSSWISTIFFFIGGVITAFLIYYVIG